MSEIGFYHLTRTSLNKALPRLLGRVLERQGRAVVLCPDATRVDALDEVLWLCDEPDWLPHGTPKMGQAQHQPIWLTSEDVGGEGAPNGARFLFLVGGAQSARARMFDRVFDLFDGTEPASVAAARQRWKSIKADGHSLSYFQQGDKGWEKKA